MNSSLHKTATGCLHLSGYHISLWWYYSHTCICLAIVSVYNGSVFGLIRRSDCCCIRMFTRQKKRRSFLRLSFNFCCLFENLLPACWRVSTRVRQRLFHYPSARFTRVSCHLCLRRLRWELLMEVIYKLLIWYLHSTVVIFGNSRNSIYIVMFLSSTCSIVIRFLLDFSEY